MTIRLRNLRTAAATVGLVIAAGTALTACQGSSSGNDADGSDKASTSASATTDATGGANANPTSAPTSAPDAGQPTKAADGTSGATDSGASSTRCRTADLGFSYGPDSGAQAVGSPGGIDVVLTNKGSGTCALQGFPGVDIISASGTHWSLARQAKTPAKVTLKAGAKASFEITYLPFDAGDSGGSVAFHAASLLVTPPGETHSASLKWDGFADVMDQSGATHPGTYVGPVVDGD